MKCPKCKTDNPEGAKFCIECGHNFFLPSNKASQEYSVNEKIKNLQRYLPKGLTKKILSQKEKIEGERKQVTVMFCDMVDFTPMVERLGPDEAYKMMDDVYEILIHKVHEFEGTVNEMTGDGVMALFGAPIAVEGATQRAIRSALAINEEIRTFNELYDVSPPVMMRTGIHTGSVIVGTLGNDLRVEFKAVGDTVNLASRMEGLAVPNSVYVTEETYHLTKEFFRFENLGSKDIKGKKTAVQVFKVLSAKEDVYRPRLGEERMIYSEMVGREKELNRLQLQVMKVINGEGSVVNLIGEAGIGKSRLVAELKNRDVMKQVTMLEGRAISMGKNLSFHPIIDILKQWARIGENDDEITLFNKLETAIRGVHHESADEIIPFVATIMGIKLTGIYAERIKGIDGESLDKLIFKNVRELLINASLLNPLILIIEDFHWADVSSIELLEFLFRLVEKQRILFINVFRPGYSEIDDQIVNTVKESLPACHIEIILRPLDELSSESLISNMLKISSLPHQISDQIVKRSDGNPFFIEEVVRSFVDEGAIVVKDNIFKVTDKINTVTVPQTIDEVLMSRMDRLEENTRNIVKISSVIGRHFFYRVLKEVVESIGDIDERLAFLKEIQLIRERQRMEEIEYLFKHALAQEVAYESIMMQKRKEIHLKVAGAIENVFKDRLHEFFGILSYHYSNSGDLNKAEEYMLKAGEEALKSSASSEALFYYQSAMDLYIKKYRGSVDSNKIADLQENIATAFLNKGLFVDAAEYFDKALENRGVTVIKKIQIIKIIINMLILISYLYFPSLRPKKIPSEEDNNKLNLLLKKAIAVSAFDLKRLFTENLEIARNVIKYDISKSQVFFNAVSGSSTLFSITGISSKISNKILEYSINCLPEHNGNISPHFYNWCDKIHKYLLGEWDENIDENVINSALKHGDLVAASGILLFIGLMNLEKGNFHLCKKVINILDRIGQEYNYQHSIIDYYELNAKMLINKGDMIGAYRDASKGEALNNKLGNEMRRANFLGIIARIEILKNELGKAKNTIGKADELVLKLGEESMVPYWYRDLLHSKSLYCLAKLKDTIGSDNEKKLLENKKAAEKQITHTAKYARRRIASGRVESYNFMGIYYWITDKQKKALKWWTKSIDEGERTGAILEVSKVYFEIGKRLLEKNSNYKELKGIKAEEYLAKARTLFEEMKLQRDLEQLARLQM